MATKFFNKPATEGGQLYWPSNIAEQFDYLEMEILRYSQRNTRLKDLASRGGVTPIATPAASTTGSTSTQTISSRLPEISTTQLIPKGKILLPVPDNLSYTDAPQWSDQSVNALGRFGAQAIADMMGGKGNAASDAIAQAAKAGQVGVIKNLLGKIGVDPNAVTQNIAGKIANPYLQQIFQGVGMRQFDFNWKLVPRNEGEQKSIHNIIKILRANVLPGFSNDFNPDQASNSSIGDLLSPNLDNNEGFAGKQNVDRWLTLPNIFNLKWKYEGGEIDSLPKLKQCVCKNISVQYTPDGVWATRMMDGKPQPIAYNLTMSFGEMSIVTNEDVITKGF